MKKILFLLLVTVSTYAQVSTGKETKFANGIRNTGSSNINAPVRIVTQGLDGTQGYISAARIAKDTVLDTNFKVIKTTTKTIQESFSKADEALFKARGTELSEGGIPSINVDPTKFNITPAVLGQIKNGTDYYAISYSGATGIPVTNISSLNTWVYLDNNGALQQQTTAPTRTDFYSKLFLARFASNGTQLIAFERLRNPSGQYSNSIRELYDYIVSANIPLKQGLDITGNANLTFNRSAGSVFKFGAGTDATPNTPSFSAVSPASFFIVTRSSVAGAQFTNVPVDQYDNNGTLTNLTNNRFVAHRIYFFTSGNLVLQYGQTEFSTLDAAKSGAPTAQYATNAVNVNGTFLGWWIVKKNATDLTNVADSYFMPYTVGSGAGGTATGALLASNNLSDVLDASVARTNIGAEAVANKSDSFTASSSTTYASTKALVDGLAPKITNNVATDITVNGLTVGRGGSGGSLNTAFGTRALLTNTSSALTAIGYEAMQNSTAGNSTAVGFRALKENAAINNTAVGNNALGGNTSGTNNTAVGISALGVNISGTSLTAIGGSALAGITIGTNTVGIGVNAGRYIVGTTTPVTRADNSFFLGTSTSPLGDNQTNQIVVGPTGEGLGSNTTVIGNTSTVFGRWWGNLLLGTSTNNGRRLQVVGGADIDNLNITTTPTTASGTPPILVRNATTGAVESVPYSVIALPTQLESNATDLTVWNNGKGNVINNTSFGDGALKVNTTGQQNTAIGYNSLLSVTSGVANTAVGFTAMGNSGGSSNTAIGGQALQYNNANGTTAIGQRAGLLATGSVNLTNTANSIYIGVEAFAGANNVDNEIVVGAGALGAGSNTATLGNTSITKTVLRGVIQQTTYTVATLPAGTLGMFAVVTDALSPTYLGALTGGGSVKCPVFYNGTAWVSH